MFIIQGKLIDPGDNIYTGHRVLVLYRKRVQVEKSTSETDEEKESIWRPAERGANVTDDGTFKLELPDIKQIDELITLRIIAPDGDLLYQKGYPVDELDKEIVIEVPGKTFFPVSTRDEPLTRLKLTGRVLDVEGKQQVANRQLILWALPEGADESDFIPVLAMLTDNQGYFSAEYPAGKYNEAYGVVSLGENQKIPIRLDGGAFPRKLLLVVEIPEGLILSGDGEVPRAPDSEDLINATNTYSMDLAGKCVDFTVPNRALEEFSFYTVVRTTEPEIKGLTLDEPNRISADLLNKVLGIQGTNTYSNVLFRSSSEADLGHLMAPRDVASLSEIVSRPLNPRVLKALANDPDNFTPTTLMTAERYTVFRDFSDILDLLKKKVPGRSSLSVDNPVDWDDEPTFYQATTIAHGHVLHFKQVWKADGYSLGDLLYSLPLAPCQKKQIAVLDWDRQEIAARAERLESEERMAAVISRDRDVSEIVNSTLHETVRGGSEARTSAAGSGLGLVIGPVIFGAAGGTSGAGSSAWQDSAKSLAAGSLQQLRDRTMQSASAVRSQRSTVVQTARQGETMTVQTEVVANHNHCHSMTVQYFEVLRHLQVGQELADVQECLFVPLFMSKFDASKALRWREPLARFLRNRALRGGFDALSGLTKVLNQPDLGVAWWIEVRLHLTEQRRGRLL
jgi:hypothetical protein